VGDDILVPLCAPDADGRAKWSVPGTPATPTPYLAYSQASGLGRIIAACQGDKLANTVTGLTSHLAAALATMAREGHGVAWLPQTLASEDQERGRLVRAGPERLDIPIEIRLFRSLDTRNKMADELWHHVHPTS
jgi:DNA-binding transcriptional LysR family regulator